jgi:hypothetical protein
VLFGDSHSTHWFEPLNAAAKQTGWQLQSWTKSACPSADVRVLRKGRSYLSCRQWYEAIMARLTGPDRPDLVILSNGTHYPDVILDPAGAQPLAGKEATDALLEGYQSTMTRLLAAGVEVAVIRDIPAADRHYRSCYVAGGDCATPRARALFTPDLGTTAARSFDGGTRIIDLSDEFCQSGLCPITWNGNLVYRDSSHLAATYSAVLTPHFVPHLQAIAVALLSKSVASQHAEEARAR